MDALLIIFTAMTIVMLLAVIVEEKEKGLYGLLFMVCIIVTLVYAMKC